MPMAASSRAVAGEDSEQQHIEILPGGGFLDHLFHGTDLGDRQLAVECQEFVLNRRGQSLRLHGRAYYPT